MKLKVTIRVINEIRSGVSAATGRAWKAQGVVIAWQEELPDGRQYENTQFVTLHNDQIDRFAELQVKAGDEMMVDLAFSTRQFNGKVFNDNAMFV